jgi:hypothetical protein
MEVSGQFHLLAALPKGKEQAPVPTEYRVQRVPAQIWDFCRRKTLLILPESETGFLQLAT